MLNETFTAPTVLEDYRGDPNSPHLAKIGGRFLYEGAKSKNRRLYEGIAGPLKRASQAIGSGRIIPMRAHHGVGDNAMLITGKLTSVSEDGHYEGLIPNTDAGKTALTLLEGGYLRHVSLVGEGENILESIPADQAPEGQSGWKRVKPVWNLAALDLTTSPGIDQATIGVRESADAEPSLIESFELTQTIQERDYSVDERTAMAKSGEAMPDGTFPIKTVADLRNATRLYGHAENPAAVKAHIITRATALDAIKELPYSWNKGGDGYVSTESSSSTTPQGADMTVADLLREAAEKIQNGETTEKPEGDAKESTTENGKLLEQAVVGTSKAKTEDGTPAAPTTEATTETPVTEAGKSISATNQAKIRTALAELLSLLPEDEGSKTPAESAPPTQITEATVQAQIKEAVEAALVTERASFEEKLTTERQKIITGVMAARRKGRAITEGTEGGDKSEPTNRELMEAYAKSKGAM